MKPNRGQNEKRSMSASIRAANDAKFEISGYAAAFNTLSSDLGGFRETVARGAFKRSLASANSDVRALFNHDPNKILGRQGNGTLDVEEDSYGLRYTCKLNPESSYARDLYASVKRGDISQCSFGFIVDDNGDTWDSQAKDDKGQRCVLRTLRSVKLLDVSPVTYPAYQQGTAVSARSSDYDGRSDAAAFDAYMRKRARQIREEIFRTAPAFHITYASGEPVIVPVFGLSDEQFDDQMRRRANEIAAQIAKDNLRFQM